MPVNLGSSAIDTAYLGSQIVDKIQLGANEVFSAAWTPAQLNSVELWLDADDSSTVTLNGSAVSAWGDKSGNNHSVSQDTAANQPIWDPSNSAYQINGKPAVKYTTDFQSLFSTSFLLSNPFSVLAVLQLDAKPADRTTNIQSIFDGNNDGGERTFARYNGSLLQILTRNQPESDGVGAETLTATINADTNPHLVQFDHAGDGATSSIRQDASELVTGQLGIEGLDGLIIGNQISKTISLLGRMGEFLIVSGALIQSEQEKIEGYLAHKWGLTASLPTSHPYKTAAP
jgi:hypothetical protein